MLESTIYLFLFTAAIFYGVAAWQAERVFLIPAGGILILMASMLLVGPGIQINAGDTNVITENKTSKKTFENRTIQFRRIDQEYDKFDPSKLYAVILIIIGLGSIIIGSNVKGGLINAFK